MMKIVDILGCSRCGVPYMYSLNIICNEYNIANIPRCEHANCMLIDDYNGAVNYNHGSCKIYSTAGMDRIITFSPAEFNLVTYWRKQLTYMRSYLEKDSTLTHVFRGADVGILLVKDGMIHYMTANNSYYPITPCTKIDFWNSSQPRKYGSFIASIIAISLARDPTVNY
jgi:hypothetical protein